MAIYSITTPEIALSASATKTLLALFGSASFRARVVEWGVSFDGISVTDAPIIVGISRFTADNGTRTTTTTEVLWDLDGAAATCVGRENYTAEPTTTDLLVREECHAQSGTFRQYPYGREITIQASTASGIGVTVFTPAAVAANAVAYIVWVED